MKLSVDRSEDESKPEFLSHSSSDVESSRVLTIECLRCPSMSFDVSPVTVTHKHTHSLCVETPEPLAVKRKGLVNWRSDTYLQSQRSLSSSRRTRCGVRADQSIAPPLSTDGHQVGHQTYLKGGKRLDEGKERIPNERSRLPLHSTYRTAGTSSEVIRPEVVAVRQWFEGLNACHQFGVSPCLERPPNSEHPVTREWPHRAVLNPIDRMPRSVIPRHATQHTECVRGYGRHLSYGSLKSHLLSDHWTGLDSVRVSTPRRTAHICRQRAPDRQTIGRRPIDPDFQIPLNAYREEKRRD